MSLRLDHLAIAARTLEEGTDWVEQRLGVSLQPGGQHPDMGTHNKLLSLGPGLYLEVIAIDPEAPNPGRARWFALDAFAAAPRLQSWIVAADDLEAACIRVPGDMGRPLALSRGDLRWRMAVPDSGELPFDNCAPALIEWEGEAHPAQTLTDKGVRLMELTVTHPEAAALAGALSGLADPALRILPGGAGLRARFSTPGGEVTL